MNAEKKKYELFDLRLIKNLLEFFYCLFKRLFS